GMAHLVWRRFFLPGPDGREPAGDAAGGGNEEMTGSTRRVTHREGQEVLLRLGAVCRLLEGIADHRVEGRIQERGDESGRGVVRTGGLAFIAREVRERELLATRGDLRHELEE